MELQKLILIKQRALKENLIFFGIKSKQWKQIDCSGNFSLKLSENLEKQKRDEIVQLRYLKFWY